MPYNTGHYLEAQSAENESRLFDTVDLLLLEDLTGGTWFWLTREVLTDAKSRLDAFGSLVRKAASFRPERGYSLYVGSHLIKQSGNDVKMNLLLCSCRRIRVSMGIITFIPSRTSPTIEDMPFHI